MTTKKEDRNRFIVDEFEEGAKISDIVNHPSVNIKHQSVRRILINKLGHEKYKEIVSGRGDRFMMKARKVRDGEMAEATQQKKSFWKWLIGSK